MRGLIALLMLLAPGLAMAVPLDFNADHVTYSPKGDTVELQGNVKVVRGPTTLTAATLVLQMENGSAKTLTGQGGVTLTRPANGSTETVKGSAAVYTPATSSVVFTGNVQLTRGANTLTGDKLVYDLVSGRASLTGGSNQVHGAFADGAMDPAAQPATQPSAGAQ